MSNEAKRERSVEFVEIDSDYERGLNEMEALIVEIGLKIRNIYNPPQSEPMNKIPNPSEKEDLRSGYLISELNIKNNRLKSNNEKLGEVLKTLNKII